MVSAERPCWFDCAAGSHYPLGFQCWFGGKERWHLLWSLCCTANLQILMAILINSLLTSRALPSFTCCTHVHTDVAMYLFTRCKCILPFCSFLLCLVPKFPKQMYSRDQVHEAFTTFTIPAARASPATQVMRSGKALIHVHSFLGRVSWLDTWDCWLLSP